MNVYQIETTIRLSVTFYNVALNLPADPSGVALFVQDPSGNVTQIPSGDIVRTGVGEYYSDFLPSAAGNWTYKWQGSGTSVVATSRDTEFFVEASGLVA